MTATSDTASSPAIRSLIPARIDRPVHRRSGRAAHAVRGGASRSPAPAAPPVLRPASRLRRSIVFAVSMERMPRPVSQPRSGTIHVGDASPRLEPSGWGYGSDAGCPPR
jgi:hypothetical protein